MAGSSKRNLDPVAPNVCDMDPRNRIPRAHHAACQGLAESAGNASVDASRDPLTTASADMEDSKKSSSAISRVRALNLSMCVESLGTHC
jgi:hypothetical protein